MADLNGGHLVARTLKQARKLLRMAYGVKKGKAQTRCAI